MTKCQDYFQYLEELRKKGIRTVIGATAYLERDFKLSHDEAVKIILAWNKKYGFTP